MVKHGKSEKSQSNLGIEMVKHGKSEKSQLQFKLFASD